MCGRIMFYLGVEMPKVQLFVSSLICINISANILSL